MFDSMIGGDTIFRGRDIRANMRLKELDKFLISLNLEPWGWEKLVDEGVLSDLHRKIEVQAGEEIFTDKMHGRSLTGGKYFLSQKTVQFLTNA